MLRLRVDVHAFSFDKVCVSKFLLNANVFFLTGATWDRVEIQGQQNMSYFRDVLKKAVSNSIILLTMNYFSQGQIDTRLPRNVMRHINIFEQTCPFE